MNKQFTITKRIAKHGKQAIIIIPSLYLDPSHNMYICRVAEWALF